MDFIPDKVDQEDHNVLLTALSYLSYAVGQAGRGPMVQEAPEFWPWEKEAWKPNPTIEQNLTKAIYLLQFVLQRIERYREEENNASTTQEPARD